MLPKIVLPLGPLQLVIHVVQNRNAVTGYVRSRSPTPEVCS